MKTVGLLAWLRNRALTKRGFLARVLVFVGVPVTVVTLFQNGRYDSPGFNLYLIGACMGVIYLGGLALWFCGYKALMEKRMAALGARESNGTDRR